MVERVHVDVEHPAPVLPRHLEQRLHGAHARVVHEEVAAAPLVVDAVTDAQHLDRTHARAGVAEQVVLEDGARGALDVAGGDLVNERRDVDARRAGRLTRRHHLRVLERPGVLRRRDVDRVRWGRRSRQPRLARLLPGAPSPGRDALELSARLFISGIDGISMQHLADPDTERSAALVDMLAESVAGSFAYSPDAGRE